MMNTTDELTRFVNALRAITAEAQDPSVVLHRVGPLARELALTRTWLEPGEREIVLEPLRKADE